MRESQRIVYPRTANRYRESGIQFNSHRTPQRALVVEHFRYQRWRIPGLATTLVHSLVPGIFHRQ